MFRVRRFEVPSSAGVRVPSAQEDVRSPSLPPLSSVRGSGYDPLYARGEFKPAYSLYACGVFPRLSRVAFGPPSIPPARRAGGVRGGACGPHVRAGARIGGPSPAPHAPRAAAPPGGGLPSMSGELTELVAVRVRAVDAAAWRSAAADAGVGLSDLIRARMAGVAGGELPAELTGRPSPRRRAPGRGAVPRADPELVAGLARIGNNLNQLARRANQSRAVDFEVLAELSHIEVALDRLVELVAGKERSKEDEAG